MTTNEEHHDLQNSSENTNKKKSGKTSQNPVHNDVVTNEANVEVFYDTIETSQSESNLNDIEESVIQDVTANAKVDLHNKEGDETKKKEIDVSKNGKIDTNASRMNADDSTDASDESESNLNDIDGSVDQDDVTTNEKVELNNKEGDETRKKEIDVSKKAKIDTNESRMNADESIDSSHEKASSPNEHNNKNDDIKRFLNIDSEDQFSDIDSEDEICQKEVENAAEITVEIVAKSTDKIVANHESDTSVVNSPTIEQPALPQMTPFPMNEKIDDDDDDDAR